MKQRVYTGKELALSFNTEVLTFNDAVLLFHQRGLTHFDVSKFTYNEIEMGAATIQFDLQVEPEIEPAFDKDWYVDFRGERYFLSSLRPPIRKDTESLKYVYSLTFKSQRADLDRYEFANFVAVDSTQQPISYDFSLPLTVQQFVARMNINLEYYFGSGVWAMVLDETYMDNLNTAIYDGTSSVTVAFSRETLWSLLTGLYDIYGLRWKISSEAGVMTIRLGYTPVTLQHTFEYGKGNGLISIERHNQNDKIYTRLSGRGSDRNLPYRYFDSSAAGYAEDPDNNSYTQNITYSAIMPISYRQYVQGWNDHAASQPADSSTYAYTKGYTDTVFNPVDYVISEAAEAIYGVWKGSVADATDIYPTLQGATSQTLGRLDQIVAVETVLNDDYSGTDASLSQIAALAQKQTRTFPGDGGSTFESDAFTVGADYGKISLLVSATIAPTQPEFNYTVNFTVYLMTGETIDASLSFSNQSTTVRYFSNYAEFEGVSPGTHTVKIEYYLDSNLSYNNQPNTVTFEMSEITKYPTNQYKQTFDVWVKNIWDSTQGEAESDSAYMHRIWDPLLVPNKDITLMFSSGLIAGEDYEFKVARPSDSTEYYIYPDTSRSIGGVNSHWRLSLLKSDANLESTGLMLPNMTINASAGDYMFFTNIQMPYEPYVRDAEERVDTFLQNELAKVDDENHGYTITPSAIFLETYAENASIGVGAMVPVADAKIIGSTAVNLGITNLTIEYSSESLLPKWTIAVADKPNTQKNSVQILQGDVKVLSSSLMSAQQLTEQITLALDSRYLRKDGQEQDSFSKTTFRDTLTTYGVVKSNEYLQGQIGGYGYCLFKNSNGDYVFEVDQLNVRKTLNVNELVINQISAFGGKYIYSAAAMEVLWVDSSNSDYDVCYLDVKGGTVVNQFIVGDHAYCQQFDPNSQAESKFFWRRVSGVGLDYIQISKTGGSGVNGTPEAGDVIAQLGHDSSIGRQAALIIDQLNGGTVTQYAKIDGYKFTDKDYVSYGVDVNTGRAYERIYGDMYIGGRNQAVNNYLDFDSSTGEFTYRGTIRQDSTVVDASGNSSGLSVDRGEWSNSAAYFLGNSVTYLGSTYYCILDAPVGTPPTNQTHFRCIAIGGLTVAMTGENVSLPATHGDYDDRFRSKTQDSYGDSYTAGVGATGGLNYVNNIYTELGTTLTNHGISGGQIVDIAPSMMLDVVYSDGIYTILPGFNDCAQFTATDYELKLAAYERALLAAVGYMSTPEADKLRGDDASLSYAGTWYTPSVAGITPKSKASGTAGSTASFQITGDVLYIQYIQQLGNTNGFTVSVDGLVVDTVYCAGTVSNGGAVSTRTYGPALARIDGLGYGVHDVVISILNTSSEWHVFFEMAYGISATPASVYIGNPCRENATAVAYFAGGSALEQKYQYYTLASNRRFKEVSQNIAALLASDGLNVNFVDTDAFDESEGGGMIAIPDYVHPNNIGHRVIANCFLDVICGLGVQTNENSGASISVLEGSSPLVYSESGDPGTFKINSATIYPSNAKVNLGAVSGIDTSVATIANYIYIDHLYRNYSVIIPVQITRADGTVSTVNKIQGVSKVLGSETPTTGAITTNRGYWGAGITYYGNSSRVDCVKYGVKWYKAKTDAGVFSDAAWNSARWMPFGGQFESIATGTLLAENANIAGFIYKNEQMISQSGTIGGAASTDWSDENFIPNLLLDGSTGEIIANSATIRGHIEANSGSIGNLDVSAGGLAYNSAGETMSLDERNIEFSADDSSNRVVLGTNVTDGGITILGHPLALIQNNGIDAINRGIYLDVSGAYGFHQAIYGNGNIGMNGAIIGYGSNFMLGDTSGQAYQMSISGGNNFIIFASVTNTAFVLPKKTDIISSLGLASSSTLFCVEVNIICGGNSTQNLTLFGRTTLITGVDTSDYPYMRDNNYGNVNSGRIMAVGDVATYLLVYDGITYDAYLKSGNY